MSGCMIIVRSVTYAQRGVRMLERHGISAYVVRPNIEMLEGGCGFAVKVSEGYMAEAIEILKQGGFEISRALIAKPDGSYREMRI